jgi:hypothetical protein
MLSIVTLLTACASTREGETLQQTGFLRAPELLEAGKSGRAQQIYIKPGVDWASYDKVLLNPVTIWRGKESQMHGITPAESQQMANYLYQQLHTALAADYQMVAHPEPHTLRISVAIVKLKEDNTVMETISTVSPLAHVIASTVAAKSTSPAFVGQASIQANVVDAESNNLLAEGADARVGNYTLSSLSINSWADVENIMDHWVTNAVYALCKARQTESCVEPSDTTI